MSIWFSLRITVVMKGDRAQEMLEENERKMEMEMERDRWREHNILLEEVAHYITGVPCGVRYACTVHCYKRITND